MVKGGKSKKIVLHRNIKRHQLLAAIDTINITQKARKEKLQIFGFSSVVVDLLLWKNTDFSRYNRP